MELSVEGLCKKFCTESKSQLIYQLSDLFSDSRGNQSLRKNEFWALKDISFSLKKGDVLGLMGDNGSGKTTLLKLIAGMILPTAGKVSTAGRVDYLSNFGINFLPDLSGTENIELSLSLLGFSRTEVGKKFPKIAEYSELGRYLDMQMKYYSSGMKARLGFAVAIHMDPEIFLVDETLSVGDKSFRDKCLYSVSQVSNDKICIFASHSISQMKQICNKGAFLKNGKLDSFGLFSAVKNKYMNTTKHNTVLSSGSTENPLLSATLTGYSEESIKEYIYSADSKVEVVIQLSRPLNGKRFRIVVVLKNVYFAVKYRLITHIGESDYKHHQAAELRIADHQQKIPHGRFLCLIHVLNDETELILQSFQLPKPVVIEAGNKLQKTTVIFVEPEINFDSRQSSG